MYLNKRTVRRWLRVLHRDIGYLAVGITFVYALSGIFMSHKNTFSATKTERFEIELPEKLDEEAFSEYWNKNIDIRLNHLRDNDDVIVFYIEGGQGYYEKLSGATSYELYGKRPFISFVNQLHNNQRKGWVHVADIYALSLLFLAVSGLFMTSGKKGFLRRGLWFMLVGVILVLIFIWTG